MAKKIDKNNFHVKVLAHKGKIVTFPSNHEKSKVFFPTGGTNLGCVVLDSKKHLHASKEALDLMNKIKTNNDCIGDLGWWKCNDDKYAFSWFGAIYRIIDPKNCEAARDFKVFQNECTIIPNDVPKEIIDGFKAKNRMMLWKKPFSTTLDE